MAPPISRWYRYLAIATALFVYLLIVVGGVVRVTGSGLGCPDWPTCYGSLLPPQAERIESYPRGEALIAEMGGLRQATVAATVEYVHRMVAIPGGALLLLTIALGWLRYRAIGWIGISVTIIALLTAVQVPLGGVVVITELEPLLVAVHLGIAFLILACVLAIALYAARAQGKAEQAVGSTALRTRLSVALVALFVVLMVGAAVVGSNTGLACPDWPLCNVSGGVAIVPPGGFSSRVWFQLLHRYTVVLYSALLVWVFAQTLRERRQARALRGWNYTLAGLFAAQVVVGAVQVWLRKPATLRALHLAVAAGVWAALVIMALLSYMDARPPQSAAGRSGRRLAPD